MKVFPLVVPVLCRCLYAKAMKTKAKQKHAQLNLLISTEWFIL